MIELCPECRSELSPLRLDPGSVLTCGRCAGLCVNAAVLKRHAPDSLMVQLWSAARASTTLSHRVCPGCSQRLRIFASDALQLDACATCQLLWLDAGELERLGVTLRAAKAPDEHARAHAHATTELQRAEHQERRLVDERDFWVQLVDDLTRFFMR